MEDQKKYIEGKLGQGGEKLTLQKQKNVNKQKRKRTIVNWKFIAHTSCGTRVY